MTQMDIEVYKTGFPGMASLRMQHLRKHLKEAMQIAETRLPQEKGLSLVFLLQQVCV